MYCTVVSTLTTVETICLYFMQSILPQSVIALTNFWITRVVRGRHVADTSVWRGLPKTWRDRRDSENGQSACPVCLWQTGQTVPSVTDRRLLKHDGKDGTLKMANLPVPTPFCLWQTGQTVPSVCDDCWNMTGKWPIWREKMACLTWQANDC